MYHLLATDTRTGQTFEYAWTEEILRRSFVRFFSRYAHYTFVTYQSTWF